MLPIFTTAIIGFVLGFFFSHWVLGLVTLVSLIIVVWFWLTWEGMEKVLALYASVLVGIFNAIMWATYYMTTKQSWLEEFIHNYILKP